MSFAEEFVNQQNREIARVTNKIVSGNCETMAEYKGLCALIAAYNQTIQNFHDVRANYLKEDE